MLLQLCVSVAWPGRPQGLAGIWSVLFKGQAERKNKYYGNENI